MSIQIKTQETDKYGRATYAYLNLEQGLELYEGGLYRLLQIEFAQLQKETERTKEYTKLLRDLNKRCEDLGIKLLKEGE
jgi:hypothetical protein